jgi:hypothetical protein
MTDEKEVVQNTEQPVAADAAAPQAGAELNISDLNGLKSVIDVATQRGAFKANELEAVGKLYNRLSVFLESVTKKD